MKIHEVRNQNQTISESIESSVSEDKYTYSPSIKQRYSGWQKNRKTDTLAKKAYASWQAYLSQLKRSLPKEYNGVIPPERLRDELENFIQTNIMGGQSIASVNNARDIEHYITLLTGAEAPQGRYAADDSGDFIRSLPNVDFIRLNVDPAILYYPPFDQRYVLNNNGEWTMWGKRSPKAPELESVQGYLEQAHNAFQQADEQQRSPESTSVEPQRPVVPTAATPPPEYNPGTSQASVNALQNMRAASTAAAQVKTSPQSQTVESNKTKYQGNPDSTNAKGVDIRYVKESLRKEIDSGTITLDEAKRIYQAQKKVWLAEQDEQRTIKQEQELFNQLIRAALLARPTSGTPTRSQPQPSRSAPSPTNTTPQQQSTTDHPSAKLKQSAKNTIEEKLGTEREARDTGRDLRHAMKANNSAKSTGNPAADAILKHLGFSI